MYPTKKAVLYPQLGNLNLPFVPCFPKKRADFDRLIEDKRIDLAVIFGAYEDGEPQGSDWGVMM